MKRRTFFALSLFLALAAFWRTRTVLAIPPIWFSDDFNSVNTAEWWVNGSLQSIPLGSAQVLTGSGSLIKKTLPPSGSEYELQSIVYMTTSSSSAYIHYYRATSDARLAGASTTGNFYAVQLENPQMTFDGSIGTATLRIFRRNGGTTQELAAASVAVRNGMVMRSVNTFGWINVYLDGASIVSLLDTTIPSGYPGVGLENTPGGGLDNVAIYAKDTTAPSPVSNPTISSLSTPQSVELQWQEPSDGPTGVGVSAYFIYRNGSQVAVVREPRFLDLGVAASTAYSYRIDAMDYHGNFATGTNFSILTGTSGYADPLRTGVHSEGVHWGAGSEQVDLRSGNLNFSLPLIRPQSRSFSTALALSYNSQIWRQQGTAEWKLGKDAGYGFGWTLMAGSITPVWTSYYGIAYYLFRDSTGTEYKIEWTPTGFGAWVSKQTDRTLRYDPANTRLYFPDGSFWVMDVIAHGTEQDAGTRYPSIMQDTNGNQLRFDYETGANAPTTNSSGRPKAIYDVRYTSGPTYTFGYDNTGSIPRLTGINNQISSGEVFTFSYSAQALTSPFSTTGFGTVQRLDSITQTTTGLTHGFTYNGSAELTKVTMPYAAELQWAYRTFNYNFFSPQRRLREVETRYLKKEAGAALVQYDFTRDDAGDASRATHRWTAVKDPAVAGVAARGEKKFYFEASTITDPIAVGLISKIEHRDVAGALVVLKQDDFSWTTTGNWAPYSFDMSKPFIKSVTTTLNPGQSYQKASKVEQDLDEKGNLQALREYGYSSLTSPVRTHAFTYLTDNTYQTFFVLNRITSATVFDGTSTVLKHITQYDHIGPTAAPGGITLHQNPPFGWPRGNVTKVSRPGFLPIETQRDTTGRAMSSWELGGTASMYWEAAPFKNDAVPGVIKPNNDDTKKTTLTWNSFFAPTNVTPAYTAQTVIGYDTAARPSSTTSSDGAVTSYAYVNSPPSTTATTNGHWTKTSMDGLGRTVKVESGYASTTLSIVETQYEPCGCSPLGKVRRTSQPYAPGGPVYWTEYEYE